MIDEQSAALLVRVWLEGEGTFRARLTAVGRPVGDGDGDLTVAVASSPEDVLAAVGQWLQDHLPTR